MRNIIILKSELVRKEADYIEACKEYSQLLSNTAEYITSKLDRGASYMECSTAMAEANNKIIEFQKVLTELGDDISSLKLLIFKREGENE